MAAFDVAGFLVVFAVVGGFELFDRTSFSIIALAARGHPFPTWAGGATAFVASTGIAVSVGAALVALLGPGRVGLVRAGAGAFLVGYALFLWYRGPEEGTDGVATRRTAFVTALATVFLLELGDTTMIVEVLFVTTWGWFVVLLGGAAALVAVAGWAAWLGGRLGARVEPALLHRVVVVVLLVVGALTIGYGLVPGAFPTLSALAPG
jgi:Ca2+/H+ antiporter, TMEM165/GDT1 family